MTKKVQKKDIPPLVFENLKTNEWACYMCLFMAVLFEAKEQEPKKWSLGDDFINIPRPFGGSTKRQIFFSDLINNNLCFSRELCYKYLYYLSKLTEMKFDTIKDWDLPKCTLENLGYTQEELKRCGYNEHNAWNIIFDKLIPDDILKKQDLPLLSLKITAPPKKEVLETLIDGYIHAFMAQKRSSGRLMPYNKLRNIIFQKILGVYEMIGTDTFSIQEKSFDAYKGFSITYAIAILWRLGYIEILNIQAEGEEWLRNMPFSMIDQCKMTEEVQEYVRIHFSKNERMSNHTFQVKLTKKFKEILKGFGEIRDIILDKIFDEEYKRISITRKHGELYMIEGEKEIEASVTKFVDLQKQYPYSVISTANHGGKAKKYVVNEKIKLDKESDKNKA